MTNDTQTIEQPAATEREPSTSRSPSCCDVSHTQLVDRARRWLKYSVVLDERHLDGKRPRYKQRCGVVATELVTTESETADAIGWMQGGRVSVLIECKTSRADFRADRNKLFRDRPWLGVGRYRFYMTPPGLLTIEELPVGWGLLEVVGRSVDVCKIGDPFQDRNQTAEMAMVWSIARRAQSS